MWNGINYLLKMPSDLDYMAEYKAITDWLGFSIVRNPCCIPYAMEGGVDLFTGALMQKESSKDTSGSVAEGFSVGGGSAVSSKFRNKFPGGKNSSAGRGEESGGMGSPYKAKQTETTDTLQRSRNSSYGGGGIANALGTVQSFVPNNEMTRIKNAELTMMQEEAKYGRLDRDPRGRLVPEDQVFAIHGVYIIE